MELKYGAKEFDGYTHRAVITFFLGDKNDPVNHPKDIYFNTGDKQTITDFINKRKSDKVVGFRIETINSKEHDERNHEFILELLEEWKKEEEKNEKSHAKNFKRWN